MRYPIPAHDVERFYESTLEVRKSRFITRVAHAPEPAAAQRLIDDARQTHPDASHHCFAFIAGAPGEQQDIGFSDDGEPGGTAGRPLYQVLAGSGLGQVAAVVIRYFGGTQLGTGGLARAYSKALSQALEKTDTVTFTPRRPLRLATDFAFEHELRRWLSAHDALIEHAHHSAHGVTLDIAWPIDSEPDTNALAARLQGRLEIGTP